MALKLNLIDHEIELFEGGTASGSCANGFGVCCVCESWLFMEAQTLVLMQSLLFIPVQLGCGQSSSENNTYLLMASTTNPSIPNCVYSLCEASPNVCRIRLDFTVHNLSYQFVTFKYHNDFSMFRASPSMALL